MYPENEKSRLDSEERNLYSRIERQRPLNTPSHLGRENIEAKGEWDHGGEEMKKAVYNPKKGSYTKKIMVFSIIFFVIALGSSFFIYSQGVNVFSSDNIAINVRGPVGVAGGDKLNLEVDVNNGNNTILQGSILKIQYPPGTREGNDITIPLDREEISLGDIEPGGDIKKNISAILFGEENTKKEIKITIEYRVKNSNAVYEKIKKFEIALTSAPISLSVDSLKEINSGQQADFVIHIASNSPTTLKGIVLKAEYPFGWSFKSSDPKALIGNELWFIGDLRPGEKKDIKISGLVQGQDGEERVFRFYAGLQSQKDEKAVEPVFLSTTQSLSIKKPFIGVNLALDGESAPIHVAQMGKDIRGDVVWRNNLPAEVTDVEIQVKITGIVNKSSVSPTQGYYNSSENTILWNSGTLSDLESLKPGDQGRASFTFSSILPNPGDWSKYKNSEILLSVDVKGRRSEESSVPEEILSTATEKVRFQTDLSLIPELFYYDGPFKNKGPIPPQAEKETTYTVTWTLTNSFNDARDTVVTAVLPPYVKWLNTVSPTGESVTYNPAGEIVTWNAGEVKAGQGITGAEKKVSFQISLLPSVTQVGQTPVLVTSPKVTAVDRFTNTPINETAPSQNTERKTDSGFRLGDEVVER